MRLIDADYLLEKHTTQVNLPTAPIDMEFDAVMTNYIKGAPTIDPMKHGNWVNAWSNTNKDIECSNCGRIYKRPAREFKYCPQCGSKMDGDNK